VGEGTVCIGGADRVRPEAEDIVEHREWGMNDCHCRVGNIDCKSSRVH
jgi:hypothetical protein